MTEIIMFHHAQGLTDGLAAIADELRGAGHTVHTPDVYDGKTFSTLDEGIAYAKDAGFQTLLDRAVADAQILPAAVVYLGFSLGAMPAVKLAMTRPGAKGVVLLHSVAPPFELGDAWPDGVPLQMHTKEADDWGDADVAKEMAEAIPGAELFLYPGDTHLFSDRSLADYEQDSARLLMERVQTFVSNV